jgi:NADH:ubiquinone oxidoreductase subunit 3 (subunit A)
LVVVFGVVIAGSVVAALLRRRRQGKQIPLVEKEDAFEAGEDDSGA